MSVKDTSDQHRRLLRIPYDLKCSYAPFSDEEVFVLEKYGTWLSALANGDISPESEEQRRFVELVNEYRKMEFSEATKCFQEAPPKHPAQRDWIKYLLRLRWERDNPEAMGKERKVDWGWHGPPMLAPEGPGTWAHVGSHNKKQKGKKGA